MTKLTKILSAALAAIMVLSMVGFTGAESALPYAEGTVLRMATGYNNAKTGLVFDAEVAGEGITLADGKTYNAGDLKPTWVAIEETLKIKFESIYQGNNCLFSRDIRKQLYLSDVPQSFLDQAILANMQYDRVDAFGFHFNATLCIPDGSSCYLVETLVSFDGQLTMKLLEY